MGDLLKTTTVLEYIGPMLGQEDELFTQEGDEGRPYALSIPTDVYIDLGRPADITVTIEPGDKLNA